MRAVVIVMVEGEAEEIDEESFCEAALMGLKSVSSMRHVANSRLSWLQ